MQGLLIDVVVLREDASAQMAILQFMASGLDRTAVPTSIHCDHLIVGNKGAKTDLKANLLLKLETLRDQASIDQNREIFDFLGSTAKKYGIQFWGPGYNAGEGSSDVDRELFIRLCLRITRPLG